MEQTHKYGRAENIFEFQGDDKIVMNDAPLKQLLEHPNVKDRKVVALSITGAYRRGKSFFLDYCLRYLYATYQSINNPNNNLRNWMGDEREPLSGFSWRAGSIRDTNGVMIWNDVFLYTEYNTGERVAIIVLDTQGLFASDTSTIESNKIFALGSSISSIQIFNLSSVIQEDQIQCLQFAAEFAKFSSPDRLVNKPFQKLLFLIRDWANPTEYEFGLKDGEKYLKDVLKIDATQVDRDSPHDFITESFDEINCALMPHPGKMVAGSNRNAKEYDGNWGEMDEDFYEELKTLIEELLSPEKLVLKKINGKSVTCAEYIKYIAACSNQLQSNKLSLIVSKPILETKVDKKMDIFVDDCFSFYKRMLLENQDQIETVNQISTHHEESKGRTFVKFNAAEKIKSTEMKYKRILDDKIEKYFSDWKLQITTKIKKIQEEKEKREIALKEKQRLKQETERQREEETRKIAEMVRLNTEKAKQIEDASRTKRNAQDALRAEYERKPGAKLLRQQFTSDYDAFTQNPIINSVDTHHPNGHPVVLQYFEQNANVSFDFDAIERLFLHHEVRNRKIVVVSIAGTFRTGKSFFADYCLRYLYANYQSLKTRHESKSKIDWNSDKNEPLRGFSWSHGCQADTSGILIWSDIFLYDKPNGENIAIALIDTQGLFEPNMDARENARIFGLSNLISSVQIYNLRNVVLENELEYLEMVAEFSKLIANSKNANSSMKPFQNLLFLIRDWTDDNFAYGYDGGNKYLLGNALRSKQRSQSTAAESKKKNIYDAYDKVDCFLLPYPGEIVRKNDYDGRSSELNENFIQNLEKLVQSIFSPEKLTAKKMLSAEDYYKFIVSCFVSFKSENLPEFQTLYQISLSNHMSSIIESLLIEYKTDLNNSAYMNAYNLEASLDYIRKDANSRVMRIFSIKPKMGNNETVKCFEKVLAEKLDQCFNEWKVEIMKKMAEEVKYKSEIEKLKLEHEKEKTKLKQDAERNQDDLRKQFQETIYQKEFEYQSLRNEIENNKKKGGFGMPSFLSGGKSDSKKSDQRYNESDRSLQYGGSTSQSTKFRGSSTTQSIDFHKRQDSYPYS